jgi:diguanylate cyclase (GGDEF)-like protein
MKEIAMETSRSQMADTDVEQALRNTVRAYFNAYFLQRDYHRATSYLSPSAQGVGTGVDEVVYTEAAFRRIYARDFQQAPNPIHYEERSSHIAVLSACVGIVTCEFDLSTIIEGQALKLNHLRASLVFAKQGARWLIEHMHLSFPSTDHDADESYPVKELEERNQVLRRLVEQRTQALQEALNEIKYLANTDKLTGIPNRTKIDDVLNLELQRAERHQCQFGLILLDIDHFKHINDEFGHLTGDRVLQELASLVAQRLRRSDTFGRWGGEEFLVLCPEADPETAYFVANTLRQQIANHCFGEINHATASFGVTTYALGDTAESVIARADAALYESKQAGRNCVTLA